MLELQRGALSRAEGPVMLGERESRQHGNQTSPRAWGRPAPSFSPAWAERGCPRRAELCKPQTGSFMAAAKGQGCAQQPRADGTEALARRGNGHKRKQRKLQLNPRKNFFPLRVTEPWPRLPREAVESPSLELFETRLAAVLCPLLWVTLLGQGAGLGDPQRSLPTLTIL